MKTIERKIVAAMIFSKDGRLFLGRKDPEKGGVYADCWHIPGGGVEEGEDDLAAVCREILEETGIDLNKVELKLIDDEGTGESEKSLGNGERVLCKMNFHIFEVHLPEDSEDVKVIIGDDLAEYLWVELLKLPTLKLTPPSIELFKRLNIL